MKKIISSLICLFVLFMVTACGHTGAIDSVTSSSSSSSSLSTSQSSKSSESVNNSSESVENSDKDFSSNSTSSSGVASTDLVKIGNYTVEKHGVPFVMINNVNKSEINKIDYVSCKISTFNADGTKCDSEQSASIGGRGNTTWTFDKKPYKIKFNSKIAPLGLGTKAKKWVLLANMCDHSFIRNSLGLSFCKDVSGTGFVPKYKEVEVYFNGKYEGLYLLTESVEVGEGRVDADNLIELSKNSDETDANLLFKDSEGVQYEIKDSDMKKSEIQDLFNNALASVKLGNESAVASLIDLNSVIDAYIIEETLNNMDVGWDSFYFTIKDGKIYFGPLWDFDVSMGNGNDESQFAEGFNASKNIGNVETSRSNLWFYYLSKQQWFRQAVSERWQSNQMQTALANLKSNVSQFAKKDEKAIAVNFAKWTKFEGSVIKKINFENENVLSANSQQKQVDFINEWLNCRIDWLDQQFTSSSYI